MAVTKRLMAPGSFELKLREDTPFSVTDAMDIDTQGFGSVVVTAAPVPSHVLASAANLMPLSIFTGVMREQKSRTTFSGAHATILLGDEDGKGPLNEVPFTYTYTISQWAALLKPTTTLTTGTYNADATTYTQAWAYGQSRRDMLQAACDALGYEYLVNDDLSLDVDSAANLYGTASVMLTPYWEGVDIGWTSIRAEMELAETVEQFTSKVLLRQADGSTVSASIGSNPFLDGTGTAFAWKRYIDGGISVPAGSGATVAAQQLGRFDQVDQQLTIRTDTGPVMDKVACGAPVYAWDPTRNIYDLTNEQAYRGRLVWPMNLRVNAVTMPLTNGLGVFFRQNGLSQTLLDLTPYMDWETGMATLEVGTPIRTLSSAMFTRGIRGLAEGGYLS